MRIEQIDHQTILSCVHRQITTGYVIPTRGQGKVHQTDRAIQRTQTLLFYGQLEITIIEVVLKWRPSLYALLNTEERLEDTVGRCHRRNASKQNTGKQS